MTRSPTVHCAGYKQHIARNTGRLMTTLIALLALPALMLMFNLGQDAWPLWLLKNRSKLIGFLLFGVFILTLLSPIIIEFNVNPRPLSGPGRDPRMPPHL